MQHGSTSLEAVLFFSPTPCAFEAGDEPTATCQKGWEAAGTAVPGSSVNCLNVTRALSHPLKLGQKLKPLNPQ